METEEERNAHLDKQITPVTPDPELVEEVRKILKDAYSFRQADVLYAADGKSALIYDGRDHMFRIDANGVISDKWV